MNPFMLNHADYYRKSTCLNCDSCFYDRESILANYCNHCGPFVVENHSRQRVKVFNSYSKEKLEVENKRLKREIINLENDLETERVTNLEMLENLKVLNEKKLTENLQIRNNEIDNLNKKVKFLEEKFNNLETKYSELMIKED